MSKPDLDYEFSKEYAHSSISGKSNNPEKVLNELNLEINNLKQNGINNEELSRIKKKIFGSYIMEYNDIGSVARMIMSDYFKGINSFEYLENYKQITKEYTQKILNEIFNEEKQVISIIKGK